MNQYLTEPEIMVCMWFGEFCSCWCLPPLLNLPAAFSLPRTDHYFGLCTVASEYEFIARLPSLAEGKTLPYTEAVIQEIHRVGSITPFAIYHAPAEDTTIGGRVTICDLS